MFLGRVIGRVWSTVKTPSLSGQRLLVVQPVMPDGAPAGRQLICTDTTGAGAGELIYWCRGRESSFPFLPDEVPTDATIVGIVDEVNLKQPAENG
ncbi:MAG: EutN/CcmL family microcompartment protein [Bryobacterales bacterium]|nr:EutN/CcmL family microcompartment protein [Bryobacterales bacterium]